MSLWFVFSFLPSPPPSEVNLHLRFNSYFKILAFEDCIGTGHSFLFLRRSLSCICSSLYNFIVFTSDRDLHQLFCKFFFFLSNLERKKNILFCKLQREQTPAIEKGAYVINNITNLKFKAQTTYLYKCINLHSSKLDFQLPSIYFWWLSEKIVYGNTEIYL